MARKINAFLAKQEKLVDLERAKERAFVRQFDRDVLVIALHDELLFGRGRINDFLDRYQRIEVELSEVVIADNKSDRTLAYSKEVIDRKLKEIMGGGFPNWEERYLGM